MANTKCTKRVSDYGGFRFHDCSRPVKHKSLHSEEMLCGLHAAGEKRSKTNADKWRAEYAATQKRQDAETEDAKVMCIYCHRPWGEGEGPTDGN